MRAVIAIIIYWLISIFHQKWIKLESSTHTGPKRVGTKFAYKLEKTGNEWNFNKSPKHFTFNDVSVQKIK
jgi:hypothetical protein